MPPVPYDSGGDSELVFVVNGVYDKSFDDHNASNNQYPDITYPRWIK